MSKNDEVSTSTVAPSYGPTRISMNIQQMMKQAQQMQDRLQKQMAECASRRPPAAAW